MINMKKEMIKLLLSHNVISEEEAKRLDLINDDSIEQSIKELGFGKTEHITKEKISENLETEEIAKEILLCDEIKVNVALNDGDATAVARGCDLTYDYVKINGDYRT